MESGFAPVTSTFDNTGDFTRYRVRATFRDWVVGGVPQKPEIIESWLRQRIMGGDEELRLALLKTLEDLEIEVAADASREDIIAAANQIATKHHGNTFRRDEHGLFLAAYQIKACLKECTAIAYPGGNGDGTHKWGPTRKSPKSFLAERVFVDEQQVYLGRMEPDGTHMQVGQVTGPRGPRSTLTYYDYCVQPEIEFTMASLDDCISMEQWRRILVLAEKIGIGALRSLSWGQMGITAFEKVDSRPVKLVTEKQAA